MGWGKSKQTTVVNNTPTDEQINTQNEKELLTALQNAGKIDVLDITDETERSNILNSLQEMEANLANPFPNFLDDTGKLLIDDVLAATNQIEDFDTRYAAAREKTARLNQTADRGMDSISDIYDAAGVEADFNEQNQKLRELNEGLKQINIAEGETQKANQEGVLSAGRGYADALGQVGADREGLLREKENVLLQEAGNIGDMMRRNAFVERSGW